jgi:tRNA(fMet)-specific endonuclease VapC
MYLLDTNIFSYIYRQNNQPLVDKISHIPSSEICLCSIVLAELIFGAFNNSAITKVLLEYYSEISSEYICYDFDKKAASEFGQLKNQLKKIGKGIDDTDLMIASICLANDLILVTNNTKHFQNIANLKIENWVG